MFMLWTGVEEGDRRRIGHDRGQGKGRSKPHRPLVYLLELPERFREHQSSNRVPHSGRAVRVQFTTLVAFGDVHARQVADAGDLDEVRGLDEGDAVDRAVRDEARAVAVLQAPRDFDLLGVADLGALAGIGGREEAEVIEGIDCDEAVRGCRDVGCRAGSR